VVSIAPAVPVLYDSVVMHSRRTPLTNRFRYRTAYWLVDLDDLPQPRGAMGLLARVRARDHLDVRALLRDSGVAADRVLMLTTARTLGYVFNPITVFWAYDRAGARTAVVAEVHNTYGSRHAYLLRPDGDGYAEADKALYVSPFYPVDGRYQIHVSEPGESISLRVSLRRDGDEPFVATLRGQRRAVTAANVLRATLRYPSARTSARIRWQGIRLWAKGLAVQPR
jgi:uncharacterized protein